MRTDASLTLLSLVTFSSTVSPFRAPEMPRKAPRKHGAKHNYDTQLLGDDITDTHQRPWRTNRGQMSETVVTQRDVEAAGYQLSSPRSTLRQSRPNKS
ncbi:hypothetical protein EYF80_004400 [Liparis tanakae]|uniref:Secreted protein n=1 Tax=Liparis tanakae TaxID=230148 RepID=A0A4Z2J6T5_9TELE|nr:hypothetical protein EYF80_004400 [Liparis tanakae]